MDTRVTTTAGSRAMLANLTASYKTLVDLQDQVSSGKQIRRPSDAPAAIITALDYRSQLRRSEQYERNTADAQNWLNTADTTLTTAQTYINRVRDLVLQGTNGGTDDKGRKAISDELRELRDGLRQLGNAQYQGRALFAGTSDVKLAYPGTGGSLDYAGDSGSVDRPIAPGVTIRANTTGPEVFGDYLAPPASGYDGNLFQMIDQFATDIQAGAVDTARSNIGKIDGARDRMGAVQAALGARAKRVEDVLARNGEVSLELKSSLADVEDVDLPKALIQMQQQQAAYQAALSVTAKVIQPSLVDFLR